MNIKYICACAIGAMAAIPSAYAQSSVTLFGVLDEGILFNSNANGGRQYEMSGGNLVGNRWGLQGNEDLGNGLHMVFLLESGFNLNTGALQQGGAEFGRQIYAGLAGPFGSVLLGRQYDTINNTVAGYGIALNMHQGGVGQLGGVFSAHPGDFDDLEGSNRINNSIKFMSKIYSGLQFVSQYSFGGVAGDFSRNEIWSAGASYNFEALSAAFDFEKINNPNFSYYGDNPSSSVTGNNMATTPVYSGYASARTQQIATAGGSYRIGEVSISAVYSNVRFTNLGSDGGAALNPNGLSGTATFNTAEVNVGYRVTPAWLVGMGYTYTKGSSFKGLSGAAYQQLNCGVDYAVSKRTDLYAAVSYQRATGYDSTMKPAVATLFSLTPSSTSHQAAAVIGIRTHF
jgi:predicted porin